MKFYIIYSSLDGIITKLKWQKQESHKSPIQESGCIVFIIQFRLNFCNKCSLERICQGAKHFVNLIGNLLNFDLMQPVHHLVIDWQGQIESNAIDRLQCVKGIFEHLQNIHKLSQLLWTDCLDFVVKIFLMNKKAI